MECGADIGKVRSTTYGLRFHDLRHHAITELAESQTSDQTIMSIAGHISPKMLALYSHVRMNAKRKALDALSGGDSGGSYGTKSDTNCPAESIAQPQVIEKIGGRERKEFELKPNFLLRLFWRTPRLPHAISASPRKLFIFISLGSGRQPLRGD